MIKKSKNILRAACIAGFLVPVGAMAQDVDNGTLPNFTASEYEMSHNVRQLSDCKQDTEKLIDMARGIFMGGTGEEPNPTDIEANRVRRNAQCEADASITSDEALAFGQQLQEKYGDDLPDMLVKQMRAYKKPQAL